MQQNYHHYHFVIISISSADWCWFLYRQRHKVSIYHVIWQIFMHKWQQPRTDARGQVCFPRLGNVFREEEHDLVVGMWFDIRDPTDCFLTVSFSLVLTFWVKAHTSARGITRPILPPLSRQPSRKESFTHLPILPKRTRRPFLRHLMRIGLDCYPYALQQFFPFWERTRGLHKL